MGLAHETGADEGKSQLVHLFLLIGSVFSWNCLAPAMGLLAFHAWHPGLAMAWLLATHYLNEINISIM
jgi:hypothetical protein